MEQIAVYTFYGLLVGVVGTGGGSALAYVIRARGQRMMSGVLSFAAGLMLSVVCFDLMPQAFVRAKLWISLGGMAAGIGLMLLLQNLQAQHPERSGIVRAAAAITVGIAMHNFPEGLCIGAGFEGDPVLGAGLAATIFLHDLPEGLSIGLPMRMGGRRFGAAVLAGIASGVPTGIGALVGAAVGGVSAQMVALCLALAGGAMLYIVLEEMLPQARSIHDGQENVLCSLLGVVFGIVISVGLG